jgi:CelD/BcsL family acetyltransferase involved in cellulose biosynthesis
MLTRSNSIYRAVLHDGFENVRPLWLGMQDHGQLTPYQRLGWLEAWIETIGATQGIAPLIVEVTRDASPVALLPLGVVRRTGCRTAIFLGDRHNNYNMPILARADDGPSTAEWDAILVEVARQADIDIFELANQPISWRGQRIGATEIRTGRQPVLRNGFESGFRSRAAAAPVQEGGKQAAPSRRQAGTDARTRKAVDSFERGRGGDDP